MSKKKTKKSGGGSGASAKAAPAVDLPKGYDAPLVWPVEFATPRLTAMCLILVMAVGMALLAMSLNNNLLGLKSALLWFFGAVNPSDLGSAPASADIAAVVWVGVLLAAATLIHPAAGLLALTFFRPWLDGYTFKTDNVYFLFGAALILFVWGLRALLRSEPIRLGWMHGLLAAFLGIGFVSSFSSVQYEDSLRALVNWSAYLALLLLTSNTLNKPHLRQWLLAGLALVIGAQALFAILQYMYVLPMLRVLLNQSPELRMEFFGTSEMTPEIARRLNKNRAFGTVLFPNALAAFLILGIPLTAALSWQQVTSFLGAWKRRAALRERAPQSQTAVAALFAWLAVSCGVFFVLQFPGQYQLTDKPAWYLDIWFVFGASLVLGWSAAVIIYWLSNKHGLRLALHWLFAKLLAVSLLVQVIALVLTWSRGGMLALAASIAMGAVLLLLPRGVWPKPLTRVAGVVAAAVLMLFAATSLFVPEQAVAQPAPQSSVSAEGSAVTAEDLTSLDSFSLRTTYWKVAARMFADNVLTGTGLGTYKWAFPNYQRLGDSDVQEAHNGYLQAFAETGLFGGLVLLAFWAVVLLTGLRAVLTQEDPERRLVALALLVSLTAFAAHSAIDINFQHPTLMFYAMLLAGALWTYSPAGGAVRPRKMVHAFFLVAVLVGTAYSAGSGLRVYSRDFLLSRGKMISVEGLKVMGQRHAVGHFFYRTVEERFLAKQKQTAIPMTTLLEIMPDPRPLYGAAEVGVQTKRGFRVIEKGQEIPPEALLVVTLDWSAGVPFLPAAEAWLDELMAIDARFPHSTEIALNIAGWYQLFCHWPGAPWTRDNEERFIAGMLNWSSEAMSRSPLNADVHENLAFSYSLAAGFTHDEAKRIELLEEAVRHAGQAIEVAPVQHPYYWRLAFYLDELTRAYRMAERGDDASATVERAQEAREKAEYLVLAVAGKDLSDRPAMTFE